VNRNFSDEWNGYLSLAYTSREPTLTNLYAAEEAFYGATPQFAATTVNGAVRYDFSSPRVKPERLFDLELGTKFQNSDAHVAADVFWMEFSNELVKSGQVDIFGQPITVNAQRTRHVGLELEGAVRLGTGWAISGNCSFSRNRIVHYTEVNDSARITYDGNPIAGFPDVLGNLRCTYESGAVTASLLGKFVGPFYTDNYRNPDNRNDAYTVWNVQVLWRLPQAGSVGLVLRGEVRNLFNRLYFMSGEGDAFFPAAERSFLLGMTVNI
jgi:iron complex outermembrane receptor protein